MIRLFTEAGFIFHSEVVIWKDPVTAMQRTKALGIIYLTSLWKLCTLRSWKNKL